MKKVILLIFLVCTMVSRAEAISMEPLLNRVFDSTNNALQVTLTGDITLENGEIIDNSTDGTVCIQGAGGTNNEDICFDLETVSNAIILGTGTGATYIDVNTYDFSLRDDKGLAWGNSFDAQAIWETTGNDNFQIGVAVGTATASGYVTLIEKGDLGNADRSPSGTSANPILRVYSSDATNASDYVEISHNQTHPVMGIGTGNLIISSSETPDFVVCGSTPSIVGNGNVGKITVGTGSTTSCVIMFDTAYTNAPSCTIGGDNTGITYAVSSDTTMLYISSSADMASDVISYQAWGY